MPALPFPLSLRGPRRLTAATLVVLLPSGCAAPASVATPPAAPATQVSDGGQVSVAVTWRGAAAGPVFDVALNTHSVDLDGIDLARQAALRTEGGDAVPAGWEAPKGGHHRAGVLTFPADAVGGGSVELVIRDIAGVAERTYTWQP